MKKALARFRIAQNIRICLALGWVALLLSPFLPYDASQGALPDDAGAQGGHRSGHDLAKSLRSGDSLFLFTNANGECFVSDGRCKSFDRSWRQSMTRTIKETKLDRSFTRHDLRAKVGSDADTDHRAQQLLGHTDPGMTRRHYRRNVPITEPTS